MFEPGTHGMLKLGGLGIVWPTSPSSRQCYKISVSKKIMVSCGRAHREVSADTGWQPGSPDFSVVAFLLLQCMDRVMGGTQTLQRTGSVLEPGHMGPRPCSTKACEGLGQTTSLPGCKEPTSVQRAPTRPSEAEPPRAPRPRQRLPGGASSVYAGPGPNRTGETVVCRAWGDTRSHARNRLEDGQATVLLLGAPGLGQVHTWVPAYVPGDAAHQLSLVGVHCPQHSRGQRSQCGESVPLVPRPSFPATPVY